MFLKGKKIVSFLLAMFMTVSLFPVKAENKPDSWFDGTFPAETYTGAKITASGNYKIYGNAVFNGAMVDSNATAGLTIGDNLDVTLWFDGNAKFTGLDAEFGRNEATPGIYVGNNSTLTLLVTDNYGAWDTVTIKGGKGYDAHASGSDPSGGSGGAAGIGTSGGAGGQYTGADGSDAPSFPGKKIRLDQIFESPKRLNVRGGRGGGAGQGAKGSAGTGTIGIFGILKAQGGAGGEGGGGGGDDGAAIGTGGGGGGAGGAGGAMSEMAKGTYWAAASGSGGGGGGQGAKYVQATESRGGYYMNGGGGGGGGSSITTNIHTFFINEPGLGGEPATYSATDPNECVPATDGARGEIKFADEGHADGGYGGINGGKGGEPGSSNDKFGNAGQPGGKRGAASQEFSNVYYIPHVSITMKNDATVYDAQPIENDVDFVVAGSKATPKFSYREAGKGSYIEGTPTDAGDYDLKVYFPVNGNIEEASASVRMTIDRRSINDPMVEISLKQDEFEYENGKRHTPEVVVKVNGVTMDSSQYQLHGTTSGSETGNYSLFVEGLGNLKDSSADIPWSIIDPYMEGVTAEPENAVYDGQPHSGTVTVENPSDAVITYSTEENGTYEAAAPQFTNAGDHEIYYKAESDHWTTEKGSMTVKIAQRPIDLKWKDTVFVYDGNSHIPSAYAANLVEGDELEIRVANDASEVGVYTAEAVSTAGKDADNYVLLPDSISVSFEIVKADAEVSAVPTAKTLTYNGNDQELVNPGTTSDGKLVYSTEENGTYTEEIPVGKETGDYEVWYKVQGDYNHHDTAAQKVMVNIAPKNIAGAEITLGTALVYNGSQQPQTVSKVTVDGLEATFKVTDGNRQTDAGTYTLTVEGTGNFTGTETCEFTISPYEATVTPDEGQSKIYGEADPELTFTADLFNEDTVSGKLTRVQGEDTGSYAYTVDSLSNKNYTFKLAENAPQFTINAKVVTAPVVTLDQDTFVYDGTAKTPAVVSVKDGETVIDASEYETEILYRNNINADDGAVAIIRDAEGGNYELPAEFEVSFTILKSASELKEINISADNVTYGDTFTVSFTPEVLRQSNVLTRLFMMGVEQTKAELYYGDTLIAEVLSDITEGTMGTFTVDTLQKKIPASAFDGKEHELKIKWGGDSNLNPSTGKVKVVLNKKALSATVDTEASKVYDGTVDVNESVALDLTGVLGTDQVTATATGTLSDKNVGNPSFNADKVVLGSADADYYSLAPEAVSGTMEVTVRPLTLTWKDTDLDYNGKAQNPTADVKTLVDGDDVKVQVNGAQTDAGQYTAAAVLTGADASNYELPENNTVEFEIHKVKAQFKSKPNPLDLVENGHRQVLVLPGITDDGVILYKLEDNGTYSEALPEAKNPGMHKIWYMIKGDKNHFDSDEYNFHATIHALDEGVVNTGDHSNMMGWLLLVAGSLTVMLLLVLNKKRNLNK